MTVGIPNSMVPPLGLAAAFSSMNFALSCKLIQLPLASYVVPVGRAGGLPPTSFRFHLTIHTLFLSYGYCQWDFHPAESAHVGRTKIG